MPLTLLRLEKLAQAHLTHGAMAGADPLTDALYSQLEAPVEEGATAPVDYAAGRAAALADAERDPGLFLAMAAVATACAAVSALFPWGFAA